MEAYINGFIYENKGYNSFCVAVYMSALFCKRVDMKTMKYTINVLNEGLNFACSNLPNACSVEY